MNDKIRQLGEKANRLEVELYNEVMDLDNHMNDCDCEVDDDRAYYDFCNTVLHLESHVFCFNCGGQVSRK